MILLESHNVIVHDVLTDRFEKPSRADIQFVDYDNVRFHLSTPDSKTVLLLSMGIQCWPDLVKYGARDHLEKTFEGLLLSQGETEPEYDVSLRIDLEQIPQDPESRNALIDKIAHFKSTAMSAPFISAFEEQASLQANYKDAAGAQQMDVQPQEAKGDLKVVKYREEEAIFIQASHDRVTIIFSTVFKDETDRVYGRVFLQEFVDARKLGSLQNAPQVRYSNREPPLEIRHLPGLKNGEDWGYVTFVLFPRHFANPAQALATINRIQLFRDYLHYHIKCSKAYMHSRMRYRVAEFLKILNRAKPEVAVPQEKKTASGRTFRRQ
ncbi:Arp2/3 complex, 34 kd subunit p34-Arc-domain-containing protein [Kockovaella imperatae]|uniref:Arp2/3 complex 34 kDa subunit n=1 Tax=Kockovaella imperatae TaxID=4999 RepID=A0A1Y1UMB6_9TREE|nr:Arp2/3 complex, 34 kd subunit p34-Arc-domain-containing protein [Kockovaella imperatae]ORX38634.1 Arp2/3 complex, 34 kd subunit p34-Arc-domain-containing protein [Kockovaella imperatae]